MDDFAFDCPFCGQRHTGLPAIAYDGPQLGLNEAGEPFKLDMIGRDLCIVDGEDFYVRAVLTVPILGEPEPMEWGVWNSLSEANFKRYRETFDSTDQAKLGPMFSYLGNTVAGYPASLGLRCSLVPQNDRQRPFVELHPDQDHPLVEDKKQGISRGRAIEILLPFLHPQGEA